MADHVARPRVEFNGKQVETQIENLEQKANKLKQALKEAVKIKGSEKEVKKLKRELNGVEKEARQLKRETISVDNVLKDLNGTSFANLRKAFISQGKIVRNMRKDAEGYAAEVAKLKTLKGSMATFNNDLAKQKGLFSQLTNGFNNYFGIVTAGLATLTGAAFTMRKTIDAANTRDDIKGNVKALTDLTAAEIDYLEKKAVEYATTVDSSGVKIQKSADEILQAFQLVGSAQPHLLKNKEALAAVTKEMLILAEAGENGIELTDAINATTKAMNQYGAASKETARYTNAMAAGAQKGAVPINEIGLSILEFGKSASKAKVPIEQSVGLIEVVGEKAGVVGGRAGIQIRNFFSTLAAGAAETNPEIVGLDQALLNLANANMTSAEYAELFGKENALVAETIITNRDYLDEMTESLTGTDTAYRQAIDNTKDQSAALAQAKNRFHEVTIELGEKLAPAMTHMVSTGKLALTTISAIVDIVTKYGKTIATTAIAIGTYITIVKAQKMWTEKVIPLYEKATQALKSMSKTDFKAMLKPNLYAAAATAVALLVVQFIKMKQEAIRAKINIGKLNKEIEKESKKANDLFNALKKTNPESEERNRIVKKLNEQYPELLKNYDLDKAGLEEIERAQSDVNEQIFRTIAARQMESDLDKVTEKANNKTTKALNKILDITDNYELKGVVTARIEKLQKELQDGKKTLAEAIDEVAGVLDVEKIAWHGGQTDNYAKIRMNMEKLSISQSVLSREKKKIQDYYDALTAELNGPTLNEDGSIIEHDLLDIDEEEIPDLVVDMKVVPDKDAAKKIAEYNKKLKKLIQQAQIELDNLKIKGLKEGIEKEKAIEIQRYEEERIRLEERMIKKENLSTKELELNQLLYEQLELKKQEHYIRLAELEAAERERKALEKLEIEEIEATTDEEKWEAKLAMLQYRYNREYELAEGNRLKQLQAEKRYRDGIANIEKEKQALDLQTYTNKLEINSAIADVMQRGLATMRSLLGEQSAMAKALFFMEQAAAIGQVVFKTAIANATARATPPFNLTGGQPWVGINNAAAAISIAGIAGQTFKEIGGFMSGGYTGFDGAPDDVAGYVHKKEFVANADATANPSVRPVLDIIDLAQKDGSIHTLDLNKAIENISITRGYQSGGFAEDTTTPQPQFTTPDTTDNYSSIVHAAEMMLQAAEIFSSKDLVFTPECIMELSEAIDNYKIQKYGEA